MEKFFKRRKKATRICYNVKNGKIRALPSGGNTSDEPAVDSAFGNPEPDYGAGAVLYGAHPEIQE